jgi:hypothetical protein
MVKALGEIVTKQNHLTKLFLLLNSALYGRLRGPKKNHYPRPGAEKIGSAAQFL